MNSAPAASATSSRKKRFRYQNLTLFQQLLVPLGVVGLAGFTLITLSTLVLERSVDTLKVMYSSSNEWLNALQGMDRDLAVLRALSLRHQASESAVEMQQLAQEMVASRDQLDAYLKTILNHRQSAQHAAEQDVLGLKGLLQEYYNGINTAMRLSGEFEKEAAFAYLSSTEGAYLTSILQVMQSLTRYAFEDLASSRDNLMQAAQDNLRTTLLIALIGGVLLLGIAFLVTRRASQRLHALLDWSKRIADGDLDQCLEDDSRDEVGQLTKAMCRMVKKVERGRHALQRAKQQAEQVAEELQLYASAFQNSGESMLITDGHNQIINVNAAFMAQTGYSLEEVKGKNPRVLSSGNTPPEVYEQMWQGLMQEGYWQGELWDRKKSGEIYPKWISISAVGDGHGEVAFFVASFSDISERKANEARIDHLAHHDPLTGLINRFNLENRLLQSLAVAQREGSGVAVMFIDLDRFKSINDTLGHHVGDKLLVEVALRLKESVRESDMVARLGGDEFVVVLTGLPAAMEVAPLAEKILRCLGQPYQIENHQLHSSPSIGVAYYPLDGADGHELMRNADTAMYHAKDRGRNNVQYFTAAMNQAASERLELENDLRDALVQGALELHCQPQICVLENRVCGVEALARWNHPQRGPIPPVQFIAIAEESGLIDSLGQWVLDEACRQLAEWRAAGVCGVRMAVNLSAKQLRSPQLNSQIAEILDKHGLRGDELELEITESAAMENPERAIQQLQSLRNMDVQLAIDDFGTGYSSLAYLQRLPIQVLKLDRAFVRDIETDENDAEISAATLALAHNLGLRVVAEGVETEAQRRFLVEHQCDYLQGYFYSQPLPAEAAFRYLLHGLVEEADSDRGHG